MDKEAARRAAMPRFQRNIERALTLLAAVAMVVAFFTTIVWFFASFSASFSASFLIRQ